MQHIQNIYKSFISNPHNRTANNSIQISLDPVSYFPKEIATLIFTFLNPNELGRSCLVSKRWRQLASDSALLNAIDLRFFFPSLRVFNELDWKTHVDLSYYELNVEDISPSDKRKEILALKKVLSSLSIEGNSGVTLLTIPQNLTLNKLMKISGSPKFGNITKFRRIATCFLDIFGNMPVDKTYRIVITNNILEASRDLSPRAQKKLLQDIGYEMPKALEAVTLLVVTYMSSGKRLYNDNPWTYTRCLEQVNGHDLTIGSFTENGLCVGTLFFPFDACGVGATLKL